VPRALLRGRLLTLIAAAVVLGTAELVEDEPKYTAALPVAGMTVAVLARPTTPSASETRTTIPSPATTSASRAGAPSQSGSHRRRATTAANATATTIRPSSRTPST
jgi:hypothetical protein